jgi:NAD(P)-dependent dehydrogenase (short-subunit alcohol dehydrogenase family)
MDIAGKVAVVTGASRGIGRAIAVALAQAGVDVVCTARSTEAQPHKVLPGTIEDTARQVQALGRRALAIPVDVSKEDEVETMARRVLTEFGRIDILVNNAAIATSGSFLEVPVRRWDLVLNVNLRGVYLCTRAFLPSMLERGSGSIINVSSYASHTDGSWGLAYSVSKAALERLTTGLAAELSPAGITVNALQIERFVSSEGFVYLSPGADLSTWDRPETVGEDLVWLASREPSFTGQILSLAAIEEARAGR